MKKTFWFIITIIVFCSSLTHAYRDLETGTFFTRDPIGYQDGPNMYCYVHCNPITHFDAFGLEDVVVIPNDFAARLAADQWNLGTGKASSAVDIQSRQAWNSVAAKDDNVKLIEVGITNPIESANKQMKEFMGSGKTIDSVTFAGGDGSPGSAGLIARDGTKNNHINADNVGKVFDGVKIEKGGYVKFEQCEVAKGEAGKNLLSQTASITKVQAIGYDTKTYRPSGIRAPTIAAEGGEGSKVVIDPPKTPETPAPETPASETSSYESDSSSETPTPEPVVPEVDETSGTGS